MFRHERQKKPVRRAVESVLELFEKKERGESLSVCGACVFHRWRSESLPAHQRPDKLRLGAKLCERVIQFLIRASIKVWDSLQQPWHRSQVEVLRLNAPLQISG